MKIIRYLIFLTLLPILYAQPPRKPVAVFLPYAYFRDDGFQIITMALEKAGYQVVVVSIETTAIHGIDGLLVKPQRLLSDINPEDFCGLVLIDGSASAVQWENKELHNICQQFASLQRVIGAIETSPIILAKAGLLKGRKATAFVDRYSISVFKEYGCTYHFRPVVRDGNIITANKSENCGYFSRVLINTLKEWEAKQVK